MHVRFMYFIYCMYLCLRFVCFYVLCSVFYVYVSLFNVRSYIGSILMTDDWMILIIKIVVFICRHYSKANHPHSHRLINAYIDCWWPTRKLLVVIAGKWKVQQRRVDVDKQVLVLVVEVGLDRHDRSVVQLHRDGRHHGRLGLSPWRTQREPTLWRMNIVFHGDALIRDAQVDRAKNAKFTLNLH